MREKGGGDNRKIILMRERESERSFRGIVNLLFQMDVNPVITVVGCCGNVLVVVEMFEKFYQSNLYSVLF